MTNSFNLINRDKYFLAKGHQDSHKNGNGNSFWWKPEKFSHCFPFIYSCVFEFLRFSFVYALGIKIVSFFEITSLADSPNRLALNWNHLKARNPSYLGNYLDDLAIWPFFCAAFDTGSGSKNQLIFLLDW